MLGWKWTKNEWASAFLEDPLSFPNRLVGNTAGTGWPDKFCHFLLHLFLVVFLPWSLETNLVISVVLGFLYEWIVDCWILDDGASALDIAANLFGAIVGSLIWVKMGALV